LTQARIRAAVAERALAAVGARAPESVELVVVDDRVDLAEVDFLIPPSAERDLLQPLPGLHRLAVVQVLSAGTDWIEDLVPSQATLCSARGARDGPVAEWVLGALLGTTTKLLGCARSRSWHRSQLDALGAATVLVVGMGSIGHRVKALLEPLGTQVVAVASRAHNGLHGVDELRQLLPKADALVLLTPLTESTRGLIGSPELAAMRDGAVVVNAARGAVIDTDALLAEVSSNRLQAVLDVTDPEPLPDDHPLWQAPGTLSITPHLAGDSPLGHVRAAELAGDQLARWCGGQALHNVVKPGSVQ
jgi:phosphoglycerate dehydrogenase-like enzyme